VCSDIEIFGQHVMFFAREGLQIGCRLRILDRVYIDPDQSQGMAVAVRQIATK